MSETNEPAMAADMHAESLALKEVPRHELPMPEGNWNLVVEHIRKFLPADQADKPMTPMDVIAYISQLRDAAQPDPMVPRVAHQLALSHSVVRDLATEVRLLAAIIHGGGHVAA